MTRKTTTRKARIDAPLAIYDRVSRDNGRRAAGTLHSSGDQRREGREIARRNGLAVLPETFSDVNQSGAKLSRPAFDRILEMVEAGTCGGVVVTQLDRLSRAELHQAIALVAEVEGAGGRIFSRVGEHSVLDPDQQIQTIMELWASAREWQKREQSGRRSRERSIMEHGAHLQATFGYDRRGHDGSGRHFKSLVVNETEARAVREAYRLRVSGASWAGVAEGLNTGDYARPRTGNRWTWKGVRQMIAKPVYRGWAYSGDETAGGFLNRDAHDPLVDERTWRLATEAKTIQRAAASTHLLSGFVRCSNCGFAMVHDQHRAGHRYYRCVNAGVETPCPGKVSIPAGKLEDYVEAEVRAAIAERREPSIRLVPADGDLETLLAAEAAAEAKASRTSDFIAEQLGRGVDTGPLQEAYDRALAERDAAVSARQQGEMDRRGFDIPADAAERWEGETLETRRIWLGRVIRFVVAFPGEGWRRDVSERSLIVGHDEAGDGDPITAALRLAA